MTNTNMLARLMCDFPTYHRRLVEISQGSVGREMKGSSVSQAQALKICKCIASADHPGITNVISSNLHSLVAQKGSPPQK